LVGVITLRFWFLRHSFEKRSKRTNTFPFREEKEKWVRAKYEAKEFLQELPPSDFSFGEVSERKVLLLLNGRCAVRVAHRVIIPFSNPY